jgi:hypothetical protein
VTYIWVTGGSEGPIIFIKFFKRCNSHYLCRPIFPTAPPYPHKALENGVARCFLLQFEKIDSRRAMYSTDNQREKYNQ